MNIRTVFLMTCIFVMGAMMDNAFSQERLEKATFAGGCFWCMEAPFEELDGVDDAVSGYIGGGKKSPNYQEVSSGATGHKEAVQIIGYLEQPYRLLAGLMYGSGLRVSEVVSLRYKDIDFEQHTIVIRNAKGGKDRATILPETLVMALKKQTES